jgi:CoA:oxalate CoA-transferase
METTPGAGQHGGAARSGPLSGVVVLDLTRVVAGPYCSMMLADMGATVIKIEHPSDPDYVRTFPPFIRSDEGERSAFFAQYNRRKLGAQLDLKHPEGRRLFLRMVAKAHVVVENFRPGTMDKLGLGYEALREANPRVIYTAISGFGHAGPNSSRPAFDNSAQAAGGLWSMNGTEGNPMRVGTIIGDLAASLYAAFGTVTALRQADATGEGQMVDVSQQDAVLSLTENAVVRYTVDGDVAQPLGNDHPFVRPYGRYPCKDGYVFFGAYTDKFWGEACRAFGTPEHARDPEIDSMRKRFDFAVYERKVRPIVEGWCAGRTKQELEDLAGDRFPLSPIKTIDEVVNDPHVRARDMIVEVGYGGTRAQVFGSPVKLSGLPASGVAEAPMPGQHNEDVMVRWLGVEPQEYSALQGQGVFG